MSHLRVLGGLLLIAAIGMGAAAATPNDTAHPMKKKMHAHKMGVHMDSALVAEATIKPDSAQAIALRQVPKGTVRSGVIERQNGQLVYSFDIKEAGKTGVEEVTVDAMGGSVISVKHETPRMEKKEKMAPKKSEGAPSGQ